VVKECQELKDIALQVVPRVLGFGDRQDDSPTFGCFDRYYWNYKLADFPCANFQESAFLLAQLFAGIRETRYYGKEPIARYALAAVDFWFSVRNNDGSVNEAYPFERSFCSTAFTAAAVSEALLLLGREYDDQLLSTALWLAKNNNYQLSNQMAAAAAALCNMYILSKDNRFLEGARRKINYLLEAFRKHGYFPEYGGKDSGYMSLTIWYLYKYYQKSKDTDVLAAVQEAVKSLESSILEHGAIDSSKESRNTQYIYPFPSIMFSDKIRKSYLLGLAENEVITPAWLDDRYCIQLAINYLEASCL